MSTDISNMVVAGSNLVTFIAGVSQQEKSDMLGVLRFADYFASQTWRRQEQWTSWIPYYRSQLLKFGCTLQTQIAMQPAVLTDTADLNTMFYKIRGACGVDQLADMVEQSYRTIRVNQHARQFFAYGRGSGNLGTFQSIPCIRDDNGQLQILMVGMHANTYATTDILGLSERTQRSIVLRLSGGVYSFSPERYAPHRESVRARLRDISRLAIQNVSL